MPRKYRFYQIEMCFDNNKQGKFGHLSKKLYLKPIYLRILKCRQNYVILVQIFKAQ